MPRHPYHIVDPGPWPATVALGVMCLMMGLISFFQGGGLTLVLFSIIQLVWSLGGWFRDVVRESSYLGHHTSYVSRGLRMGFLLFLSSEVMFFVGIFWAFFHSALSPTPEIGCTWPPIGVEVIDPFAIPLVNTIVLVASGVAVTYAHHSVMAGRMGGGRWGLMGAILLGVLFMFLQSMEYTDAPFSMADGIYGSCFFLATGFHGFHVCVGIFFLFVGYYRLGSYHFATNHHLGLEFGIWYWHFVDVVWVLLYFFVYHWGGA